MSSYSKLKSFFMRKELHIANFHSLIKRLFVFHSKKDFTKKREHEEHTKENEKNEKKETYWMNVHSILICIATICKMPGHSTMLKGSVIIDCKTVWFDSKINNREKYDTMKYEMTEWKIDKWIRCCDPIRFHSCIMKVQWMQQTIYARESKTLIKWKRWKEKKINNINTDDIETDNIFFCFRSLFSQSVFHFE